MRPVSEIRRENLELLIEEEGTIPALNEKLGRRRNDPSLSLSVPSQCALARASPI